MTTLETTTSAPQDVTPWTGVSVREGLVTLGGEGVTLRSAIDDRFVAWATACGAELMAFPPLVAVQDLALLDYFQNFPHLALLASGLNEDAVGNIAVVDDKPIDACHLDHAGYALPSAACYSGYLHWRGSVLTDTSYFATVANCFRRENRYDALRRLHGFTMREIVCIGSRDAVIEHLSTFKSRILAYAESLGLPLHVEAACDPFFEPSGSRALLQQLFPVKEEFVFGDDLAIASVNFHRNFFGERCDIRLADGSYAFTGCVAFGLERWMSALLTQFGDDPRAVVDRLKETQ